MRINVNFHCLQSHLHTCIGSSDCDNVEHVLHAFTKMRQKEENVDSIACPMCEWNEMNKTWNWFERIMKHWVEPKRRNRSIFVAKARIAQNLCSILWMKKSFNWHLIQSQTCQSRDFIDIIYVVPASRFLVRCIWSLRFVAQPSHRMKTKAAWTTEMSQNIGVDRRNGRPVYDKIYAKILYAHSHFMVQSTDTPKRLIGISHETCFSCS